MAEDVFVKEQFLREIPLFHEEGVRKLKEVTVAVFGLGGVGSFCAEALVRAGVGHLILCDSDRVEETNLNRQLIALHSEVGRLKTEAACDRYKDINPDCGITVCPVRFSEETAGSFDFSAYDYAADCIDDVRAKVLIAEQCHKAQVPLIMAGGAGNKLDPTKFQVADISKTTVCPLMRSVRRALKERGIQHVKCVFSTEEVRESFGPRTPSSVSFVPSVMGLIMAGEILKDLLKEYI